MTLSTRVQKQALVLPAVDIPYAASGARTGRAGEPDVHPFIEPITTGALSLPTDKNPC